MKLIEEHELGDKVEVFFNISSREYNNRYYHNVDAWKINIFDPTEVMQNTVTEKEDTSENLPF